MSDLYNDNDPGAAAWLRELIAGGHIPEGQVDERSILDVEAGDTAGFRRCHWFAGIGGWAEALRLAAWPDAIPCWTGSPPCQPFSAAGKRAGRDDARHLGPAFVDLVRAARPPVLFGEQVASADVFGHAAKPGKRDRGGAPAWAWCDDLFLRLEAAGYAAWALDIPAAGIGAPHIRQRCFFAAVDLRFADGRMENAELPTSARQRRDGWQGLREQEAMRPAGTSLADGLDPARGDTRLLQRDEIVGLEHGASDGRQQRRAEPVGRGLASGRGACGLADADCGKRHGIADGEGRQRDGAQAGRVQGDSEPAARCEHVGLAGPWKSYADWFGVCWHPACQDSGRNFCDCPSRGAPNGWRWDADDGWLADAEFAGVRTRGSDGAGSPAGSLQGAHGERERLRPHAVAVDDAVGTRPGPTDDFWRDADWLFCRDGKWRPAERSFFGLDDGLSGGLVHGGAFVPASHPLAPSHKDARRVMRLRGYGNAIVPQAAAEAIAIARDTLIDSGIWTALCREYAA